MIRYKLLSERRNFPGWKRREAFIILRAESREQLATIEYEGDPVLIDEIKWNMAGAFGRGGRGIGELTNPVDLNIGLNTGVMKNYEPELIEGREILEKRDS